MRNLLLTIGAALAIVVSAGAQTDPYAAQQEVFHRQRVERVVRDFDEFVRMAYYAAGCRVIDRSMAGLIVKGKQRRVQDLEHVDVAREVEPNAVAGFDLVQRGCDWWYAHPEDVDHVRRLVAIETGR